MNKDEMMKRYQFYKKIKLSPLDPINQMLLSGSYQTLIQPVDEIDDAITKAIIETAKENGINEVWLLNKPSIISALEKQIPKRVKEYRPGSFCCLSCGAIVHPTAAYCKHCGQALEWGDGE